MIALLAALAVQGTPIVRAESLLAAGDTARAVDVLASIPVSTAPTEAGISATFVLGWIGRGPKWIRAQQIFFDHTKPQLTEWLTGGPAAMVLQEDVEEGPRRQWHPGVTPATRLADGLPRELVGRDTAHTVAEGATRFAVSQYDLYHVAQGLRNALPVATQRTYAELQPGCTRVASPWTTIKGYQGECHPPGLGRIIAADSELAPHLNRARRLLRQALSDPWPFNELAARTLIALELNFGERDSLRDLLQRTRDASFNESARRDIESMLLAFGGWPDQASVVMEAAPERFAALDTLVRPLENSAHLKASVLWRTGWPLYLEPWNERLVVHRARVLAADLQRHWMPPTYLDEINPSDEIIQRGFPLAVAQAEVYDSRIPDGVGSLRRHIYYDGRNAETLLPASEQSDERVSTDVSLAATAPVGGQKTFSGFVPSYYDWLVDLPHQVMRYQRHGEALVDFFAQPPPIKNQGCRYERGLFLLGPDYTMLLRSVDTGARGRATREHYTVPTGAGSFVYSLEVRDTACGVAARARHALSVPPARSGLSLSDVLLAEGNVPLEPRRVDGPITVVGIGGLEVSPGAPVSLYWEAYGVVSDSAEPGRLLVELEAVDVRRGRVPVQLIGDVQHEADNKRADATLRYVLPAPPGNGPLGLGVTIQTPAVENAVVRVRVSVTDQKTGRKATGTRTFYVAGRV